MAELPAAARWWQPGVVARCQDCGAQTSAATCSQLFYVLLALDHSRRPPWGPLHAVVTAAYLLQHPSDPRARSGPQDVPLMLIQAYVRGGEPVLAATVEQVRRSHHAGTTTKTRPGEAATPRPRTKATVTIHDVALDGTFPAAGHPDRVRRWAATLTTGPHHDDRVPPAHP